MNENAFVSGAILLCAVMVPINLLLVRRRGASGYLMACAFLVFGTTLYAYLRGMSNTLLAWGGFAVALLLAADFIYRAQRK